MQLRDWEWRDRLHLLLFPFRMIHDAQRLGVGEPLLEKQRKTIFSEFSANEIIFLTILVPFGRNRRNAGGILRRWGRLGANFRGAVLNDLEFFHLPHATPRFLSGMREMLKRDNDLGPRYTRVVVSTKLG